MPSYDYRCKENNQVVEVKHSMKEKLNTWGEVCHYTGIELGDTSADSPVERLIAGGQIIQSGTLRNPEPSCASGACCPGGACGLG
ncbi:MAG: zinc ribbon domain-containing protein [Gammaproteobacteria bacterium]|nr:MAG: zinc ribbon domain-containing protein [Gammaproteobacteria bacterium]RKZ76384.1 MAG: zinc ribbon domain-containing protein [Gammaproteobacteria bacterium]